MLEMDRINVFYGDVHVLWDVSLKVSSGEMVTVIGPNGAGKSTLLKALVNLLSITNHEEGRGGKITFLGGISGAFRRKKPCDWAWPSFPKARGSFRR